MNSDKRSEAQKLSAKTFEHIRNILPNLQPQELRNLGYEIVNLKRRSADKRPEKS